MAQGDKYFLLSSTGEKVEVASDMSVGRSADSDLVISEGQPSRLHAKITFEGGAVFVEDLGSTNGTFVNGSQLSVRQQLNNGDELAFDVNKFKFEVQSVESEMDRTVLRQVEDPNRTVLRPMPTLDKPAEATPAPTPPSPPPPAPEPVPEPVQAKVEPVPTPPPAAAVPVAQATPPVAPAAPAAPAAAKSAPAKPTPGSWADPNDKNVGSTQFFSAADLQAMRSAPAQEHATSDVPILQIVSGGAAGSAIQLNPEGGNKEWSIGSDAARDIVFTDQGVSEFHTILVHENGRWKVVDQMSTNGTFVNGNKTVSGFLNSGDKIRIGTVECDFLLPTAGGQTQTAKSGSAGGSKIGVTIGAFVAVLAVLFGAYFLL